MINDYRKILVILSAGIGDLFIAVPAMTALRRRFPKAKIDLLTSGKAAEYARLLPQLDTVYVFDNLSLNSPDHLNRKLLPQLKLLTKLRGERYDLAINLYELSTQAGALKMQLLLKLIRPKLSAGRDTNGMGAFYDLRTENTFHDGLNHGEHYARLCALFGAAVNPRDKVLPVSGKARAAAEAFFAEETLPLLGINPGSARRSRLWTPENFVITADTLCQKFGWKTVIFGGHNEESLARSIAAKMDTPALIAAGHFSLEESLAAIRKLKLLITTHSSMLHAANAFDIPFIGLCGISDVVRDAPYAPAARYAMIDGKLLCANPECGDEDVCPAMLAIKPKLVVAKACEILRDENA